MTDLSKILYYQNLDSEASGKPLVSIDGFSACNNATVSDKIGYGGKGKSIHTWIAKGDEGWSRWGYVNKIIANQRLTVGDHLWWRQAFYFPADSKITGDHGSLKTFRVGRMRGSDQKRRGYIDVQIRNDRNWRSLIEYDHDRWTNYNGGRVEKGKWQMFELYVYLHPDDGVIRLWRDGQMFGETLNLPTMPQGHGVDSLLMHTYWNGGSPITQESFMDEITYAAVSSHTGRDDRRAMSKDAHGNYFLGLSTAESPSQPPVAPPVEPPVEPPVNPPVPPVEPPEAIEGGITLTHDKTMVHIGDNEVAITSDKPVNVL